MNEFPAEPVLTCQNLSVSYDGHQVLQDISLTVRRGEIVAILGANGVGKTTLIRTLAGLPQLSGQSTVGNVSRHTEFAFVHQQYQASLLPWYSARRNMLLGTLLSPTRPDSGAQSLEALLEGFGLSGRVPLDRRPEQLSGGQRQLVALVRALILNRPLLILDEPMSSLDKSVQLTFAKRFREVLKSNGHSAVVVLHDFHMAAFLSDRCIALIGSPATVGAELLMEDIPRSSMPEYIARPSVQAAVTALVEKVYS